MKIEIKSDDYHPEWCIARIKFILNYFNNNVENKKILELGSYKSDIGGNLANFGANVTCVEGQEAYMNVAKQLYPKVNKFVLHDCDKEEWPFEDHYDAIIHFGLLYHMNNPDYLLVEAQRKCDIFFLETEVIDNSEESIKIINPKNNGLAQGLNSESRLSVRYIENRLSKFKRYDFESLNGGGHIYDWKEKNDSSYVVARRRLWVCDHLIK